MVSELVMESTSGGRSQTGLETDMRVSGIMVSELVTGNIAQIINSQIARLRKAGMSREVYLVKEGLPTYVNLKIIVRRLQILKQSQKVS